MALSYDASATKKLIDTSKLDDLAPKLIAARDEVVADVELMSSGSIPEDKQPLDAGFLNFPANVLQEASIDPTGSLLGRIEATAKSFRESVDACVLLGIGGSYMGMRALQEALCSPIHNELPRSARGVPRLYYEGNNVDSDVMGAIRDYLMTGNAAELEDRWGIVVISKSGGTLETAAAFRIFREALEKYYGPDSEEAKNFVIPVTGGEGSKLRALSEAKGYPEMFPVPDGIGGRFSVLTAVGLVPAAVLGINIKDLLQGAADFTEKFKTADVGSSPALDYTAICHLCERDHGMTTRILSTWGKKLEAVGLWYDQLLAESLGKEERGALPLTIVNTRDLHSRGQQHQEGRRDKLITNVIVGSANNEPVVIPEVEDDADQLNKYAGKTIPEVLDAAIAGTNKAYADDKRPTADIKLPQLDAYHIGELLQMLMIATVVEGRLIGINPYGQPGVEAYKQNMNAILSGQS
ncbi:glucose-6-phosphate isomerase [Stratiformator vulcanicus]|uniref:Glucose-6-phosphate isomerase n=1 Tax=Stratiformator vulcanicus TaxID=2527980 RepID=A0A517QVK4_9PLAN|nr:glucose-6-phosphate isomerase [Stratiformator vulcanicus]QDT35682.1 Glucose-6-phosphate isomerase [Stratiformator vulcanicus]